MADKNRALQDFETAREIEQEAIAKVRCCLQSGQYKDAKIAAAVAEKMSRVVRTKGEAL
jgi:hypothetical protein